MSRAHSPTFSSLHLRHSSFSNPSVALPTSQLILHPFRCFTYVTAHSPTFLSLLIRHRLFTYVTWGAAHDFKNGWYTRVPVSDIYEQSSFSNFSVTSPTSQLIIQPFFRFSYVTSFFTYVTWRAAHDVKSGWDIRGPVSDIYELSSFSNLSVTSPNVTAHSANLLSPYLCHSSFSNPSVASPTSQLILQHFFRFSYITCSSLTSPGESPMM